LSAIHTIICPAWADKIELMW